MRRQHPGPRGAGPLAVVVFLLPALGQAAGLSAGRIDQLIEKERTARGIAPARPVDDAGFLRRVYLDLIGSLPPPEAITAFLGDRAPDRRARVVDALLVDPRHADHFTDYWEGVLFPRSIRRQEVDRAAFRAWLALRLRQNLGWDRIVYELVSAAGLNTAGAAPPGDPPPVNGAVNFLLQYERNPQDLGGVVAREFLGVQIQCAQCHKHPTERFTQDDFRRFAACFARLRERRLGPGPAPVKPPIPVELQDADRPQGGGPELREIGQARPAALDGTDLSGTEPRRALAAWMTGPKNPYLAREIVNRYWAYLLGRGFFMPVDDLRPSNPAVMPRLLSLLAEDFVRGGFDLRRLFRLICGTRAYQLSAGRAHDRDPEHHLWSRYRLRPMGPLELLDAIAAATDLPAVLAEAAVPAERLEQIRAAHRRAVSFVFDVDEEVAAPRYGGTVQQALWLMNGSMVNVGAAAARGGALWGLVTAPGTDEGKIEALYLRTLSRRPAPEELQHWIAFLDAPREMGREERMPKRRSPGGGAGDPLRGLLGKLRPAHPTARQQAYEDLMWALLNSSEFLFRH